MAKDKPSFVAYIDWKETFDALPNDKAGELIKHIFAYVNDENPQTDDILIKAVFANIKNTLKRDLRKYEQIREKRSEAGKASANKRQQVSTSVESVQQTSTNSTVSVNGSVSVSGNVTEINSKKNLQDRKVEFSKKILTHIEAGYISREDANDFYFYWTEHGENDRKMKFEKQKSFGVKQRLRTWKEKKKNFAPQKKKERISLDEIEQELLSQGTGIDFNNPKLLEP